MTTKEPISEDILEYLNIKLINGEEILTMGSMDDMGIHILNPIKIVIANKVNEEGFIKTLRDYEPYLYFAETQTSFIDYNHILTASDLNLEAIEFYEELCSIFFEQEDEVMH